MQPLFLKIFHHGSLLKTRPFVDDQISIGSGEGLNLQLEGLSPWHVLIEKKLDKYFIFDLGSEEGTYLNGDKVTGEVEIVSGSKITLGDYEIQFFIGAPQNINAQQPRSDSTSAKQEKEASVLPKEPTIDSPSASKISKISKVSKVFLSKDRAEGVGQYKKPDKKGYWKTFAPPSKISNLDEYLEPSIGNLVEVIVAWKERVLSTYHFHKNDIIYIGSSKNCQIHIPNLLGTEKYKLMRIKGGAQVYFTNDVQGALIQGKDKSTRTVRPLINAQNVQVKPYEMIRLDFKDAIKVYVRIVKKPHKPPFVGLFNLNFSETVSLFLSVLLTSLLIFYAGFYGPAFLLKEDKFIERNIRVAIVKFDKVPKASVVDYKLTDRSKKPSVSKPKKVTRVKPKIRIPKKLPKKRPKRTSVPKTGKRSGKVTDQAPSKKRRTKVSVGTVRPGGSIKTGKQGSSAKTVAPDPSKVGLLGVFGGGGKLSKLDKGASGSGGLVGLAQDSTGYAGTKDAYGGQGIGTKTKEVGSGGKGSSLVGISGIKTKGRGGSVAGTKTGGLGTRGRMSIEFGEDDIDVEGEIDRAGILRVLLQNKVKFDNCYQFSLQQESSLQGALRMQWEILPNGNVRSAVPIDDKVGSKALSDCVSGILRRLNFPAPPSGQIPRVAFRFVFSI